MIKNIKALPDVLYQEVSGETVLLNLKTECYFGLDEVGTQFWKQIQKKTDLQEVIDSMLEEYDVSAIQLKEDINNLIIKMLDNELIEVDEE